MHIYVCENPYSIAKTFAATQPLKDKATGFLDSFSYSTVDDVNQ